MQQSSKCYQICRHLTVNFVAPLSQVKMVEISLKHFIPVPKKEERSEKAASTT